MKINLEPETTLTSQCIFYCFHLKFGGPGLLVMSSNTSQRLEAFLFSTKSTTALSTTKLLFQDRKRMQSLINKTKIIQTFNFHACILTNSQFIKYHLGY